MLALVGSHGVVAIQRPGAGLGVDASEDRGDVVREEAFGVEDGGEALGAGADGHGFVVLVRVHLDDGAEAVAEREAVGLVADEREDEVWVGGVGGDRVEFGEVAGLDRVAGGAARVAGEDGVGGARDTEGRPAIVGVPVGGGGVLASDGGIGGGWEIVQLWLGELGLDCGLGVGCAATRARWLSYSATVTYG